MASANATYGQKESSDQNFDYMFKILIIGNSSVGKTSFLFRYADDSFTPAFVSTVGIDFKVKTIYRNDKRIKLQIWVRKWICVCLQKFFGCQPGIRAGWEKCKKLLWGSWWITLPSRITLHITLNSSSEWIANSHCCVYCFFLHSAPWTVLPRDKHHRRSKDVLGAELYDLTRIYFILHKYYRCF